MFRRLIAATLGPVVLSGCVGPLVEELDVDAATAARLQGAIPILTAADIDRKKYEVLGMVSATSCFNNFLTDSPASVEHALDQLRFKAEQAGGNAILAPICQSEGTDVAKNCWSSVTCTGSALRVAPGSNVADATPAQKVATSGTCFFVTKDGLAATSAHIVDGASRIEVTTSTGSTYPATVERISRSTDVAVLRVSVGAAPYLSLSPSRGVMTGDRVFTLGFPFTEILGSEPKFTDGAISSLSGIQGEQSLFQVTVPVQPGNSGGPLVTESGEVVGVIASTAAVELFFRAAGTLPQNINWAVKSEYVASVGGLDMVERPTLSRSESIAQAKQATCRVVATR